MGALLGESDFGEAQEDEAEDGLGVLRSAQAAVGAELVGSGPEALFQRVGGGVLFGWSGPVHEFKRGKPTLHHPTKRVRSPAQARSE